MVTSIAASLGIGSGLDTASLVEQLSAATKAPKEAAIVKRETANTAKISQLASAVSGIDGFASALSSLISGGTLFTQPTSSDSAIVNVSAVAGSRLGNLAATIEVKQLATAQTLVSAPKTSAAAAIGQGQFTLTASGGTKTITIDATNDSMTGLAKAINDANVGVTASIVTDTTGARLVLKGVTGAAQGFSLTQDNGDPALAAFTFDPNSYNANAPTGLTRSQTAKNAIVALDGIEVQRTSNSFSDLITGVKIDLRKEAVGTTVSIGASRPTDAIKQAVSDFVAAYNELKGVLDTATAAKTVTDGATNGGGALRGDPGISAMQRQLAALTTARLVSQGNITSLAQIGVATNRDGTLSFNSVQLEAALATDPDGVEGLFNPGQYSSNPLVSISSAMGKAKPGTYTVTDLVVGPPPSGKIGGVAATASGNKLIAAAGSPAVGLVLQPLGSVASATITVDAGLGGTLTSLRNALRASSGVLSNTDNAIKNETKVIAAERLKMEARATTYHDQLQKSFTAMDVRVAAYKSTQSFLEQQVKVWTSSS